MMKIKGTHLFDAEAGAVRIDVKLNDRLAEDAATPRVT